MTHDATQLPEPRSLEDRHGRRARPYISYYAAQPVSAPMKTSFSILHISDLHDRGPREREQARRERVLGDAWLANLDELRTEGIDLLCMTGDLAQSGKRDEYNGVSSFLDRTLKRLGLDRDRLFVVPGNHDIDRSRSVDAWQSLRSNIYRADALDVSRWIAGGSAPLGLQMSWRNSVLLRQKSFRMWLQNFGLAALLPGSSPHARLGYRSRVRLPGLPFDVYIIGLDSAWLSGGNDDASRLLLTDSQIQKLCRDEQGKLLTGFRLALMHHPLSDISDGSECRRLLADSVNLLLRGHLHETNPELWADPDRRLPQFAAGSLFEGSRADRYANGCTVIRVTCDPAGRPQRYDLRFRSFSPLGGHWHDDNSLYRNTQNGRLTIDISHGEETNAIRPPTSGDSTRHEPEASQASLLKSEIDSYRRYLQDKYTRNFPSQLLGWRHSQLIIQRVSSSSLFVPQKLRRIEKGHDLALLHAEQGLDEQTVKSRNSEYETPEQILCQNKICLLLGVPGSGKTELTRWIALQLITQAQGFPGFITPILIELSDLAEELNRRKTDLGGITGYAAQRLTAAGLAIASSVQSLTKQGELIFIFDGMDEVRLQSQRIQSKNRFVLKQQKSWFLYLHSARWRNLLMMLKLEG